MPILQDLLMVSRLGTCLVKTRAFAAQNGIAKVAETNTKNS
jgi:hypothetical protein